MKYLFLILSLLFVCQASAQEVVDQIIDNTEESRVILNEQLRRTSRRVASLEGGINLTDGVTGILPLTKGGTGSNLTAPTTDSIVFYDVSGSAVTWLKPGSGLSITGTNINVTNKQVEVFTTSGTWTAPTGVNYVVVTLCGGGGGGAGGHSSNDDPGGGGGGGACLINTIYKVTPGNTYTVTVGAGGAAGTTSSTPTNGGNGGSSTFSGGAYDLTANAGSGGHQSASSDGDGGAGGAGTFDDQIMTSFKNLLNGTDTSATANTSLLTYPGGEGALSTATNGGAGGNSIMSRGGDGGTNAAGAAGTGIGAGGGGGDTGFAGGAGGQGIVVIQFNVNGTPS
jgi:hypothetical protein